MAKLFLQVILLVAVIGVLDCAPASPAAPAYPPLPRAQHAALGDSSEPKDASTTPKSRPVRQAPQSNNQSPPRSLLAAPKLQNNDPTTTPKTRVARADDAASHDTKPVHLPNVPLGLSRDDLAGHSTTPKSRQAREVNDYGVGDPKLRPVRAADHEGKPHDDVSYPVQAVPLAKQGNDGHSTTPKSRPARAAEEQPNTGLKHPVQAVPLLVAKQENPQQNANPKPRPARLAPIPPAALTGQQHFTPLTGQTKEEKDKKQEEKTEEHRHRRDTEEPQEIYKQPHILLKGEPVPINFDDKQEETARHQSAAKLDRARRDVEKKNEGDKEQPATNLKAHVAPAQRPAVGNARHQRDVDKPASSSNPATSQRQFASSHGPTQGDLENIRRAKEEHQQNAHH